MKGGKSNYQDLFDQIAGLDPSKGVAEELVRLAEKPIKDNDALELLVLAEEAAKTRQWKVAAQLFSLMMVNTFVRQFEDQYLTDHAKCIVLFLTEHEVEFESPADLLLYGHRRLTASLRSSGIQRPHREEWKIVAISQLLHASAIRQEAMMRARDELTMGNGPVTTRHRAEIASARKLLSRALKLSNDKTSLIWAFKKWSPWHIALLVFGTVIAICLARMFGKSFVLPVSEPIERSGIGLWLRSILVAWPLLLVTTWIFAFLESMRTQTLYFVSPRHLLGSNGIIAGEIVPFSKDWFFHIFQFVWVGLLLIAWLLFKKWEELPGWLPSVWATTMKSSQEVFMRSLKVPFFPQLSVSAGFWSFLASVWNNDVIALLMGTVFLCWAIMRQCKIQRRRMRSNADMYWWDRRINPVEWWVRLIMVALDLFLVAFLLAKILMILFTAYELVAMNVLRISYFSPDEVGGLKNLTDVLMYLSWIVFLFGMFVLASLYLHWNLREYRKSDLTLVFSYVLLLVLMVAPLGLLDARLSAEKEAKLGQLIKNSEFADAKLSDVAKYAKDVDTVHNWHVSVLRVGILGNPVLPLGFQFLLIVLQAIGRAGKLPKLPSAILSTDSVAKGDHEVH